MLQALSRCGARAAVRAGRLRPSNSNSIRWRNTSSGRGTDADGGAGDYGRGGDRREREWERNRGRTTESNRQWLWIGGAVALATGALSYASVPLYRMYCQATGYGGTTKQTDSVAEKAAGGPRGKALTISFTSQVAPGLPWSFVPEQAQVRARPGETVLVFYRAKNTGPDPIIGVATYNVTPFKAGQYFSKIQCFCFEEQKLQPGEELEMPVFFFVDPDFADDPDMDDTDHLTLAYTFFRSGEEEAY